jgi:hypothetical protein
VERRRENGSIPRGLGHTITGSPPCPRHAQRVGVRNPLRRRRAMASGSNPRERNLGHGFVNVRHGRSPNRVDSNGLALRIAREFLKKLAGSGPGRPINVRHRRNQHRKREGGVRSRGFPRASKPESGSGGSFPCSPPFASDTALMITVQTITNTIATMRLVTGQNTPTQLRRCNRALIRAPGAAPAGTRAPTDRASTIDMSFRAIRGHSTGLGAVTHSCFGVGLPHALH